MKNDSIISHKILIEAQKELISICKVSIDEIIKSLKASMLEKNSEIKTIIQELKTLKIQLKIIKKNIYYKSNINEELLYEISYALKEISNYIEILAKKLRINTTKIECSLLNINYLEDSSEYDKVSLIYKDEIKSLVKDLNKRRI